MQGASWVAEWSIPLLSIVAGVLVFADSLHAGFLWDDRAAIVSNRDVQGNGSLWELLEHDFWGQEIRFNDSHKSFRPIVTLTYRLQQSDPDLRSPAAFHGVNILLHACAVACVYWCICQWTLGMSRLQSGLVSLLFAVHPVHVDAVASLVGRAEVMAMVFFALSVAVYNVGVQSRTVWTAVPAGALVGLAFLSKEVGVTSVAVFVALDALAGASERKKEPWYVWMLGGLWDRLCWVRLCLVGAVLGPLLAWRFSIHQGSSVFPWRPLENRFAHMPSGVPRSLSIAHSHAQSVGLMLYPTALAFDHGLGCNALVLDIFDSRNLSTILVYSLLIAMFVHGVASRNRVIVLSLAVALASYIPASNVFMFVGMEVAERVLYTPSFGFLIALVETVATWPPPSLELRALFAIDPRDIIPDAKPAATEEEEPLAEHLSPRRNWWPLWLALAVAYGVRTVRYVPAWRDEESLFRAGVEACPLGAKSSNNLAYLLDERPDASELREQTEQLLRSAIRAWPQHSSAMLNLARVWNTHGLPPPIGDEHDWCLSLQQQSNASRCGPASVDDAARRARAAGALSGTDAGIPLLWLSAVALQTTPPPTLFQLGRYYVMQAASDSAQAAAVTPESVRMAREKGLPHGSVLVRAGRPARAIDERGRLLGGDAMVYWASRFVNGKERMASQTLEFEATPIDHAILPDVRFGWIPRHATPYPPHADAIRTQQVLGPVPCGLLGVRLLEEATSCGAQKQFPAELFQWRSLSAMVMGDAVGAEQEAQSCLKAVAETEGVNENGAVVVAVDSDQALTGLFFGQSCGLLTAGAVMEQGRLLEGETILRSITASASTSVLANLSPQLANYGMPRAAAFLAQIATEREDGRSHPIVWNNYGFALEIAGRPFEATRAYQIALSLPNPPRDYLQSNLARAQHNAELARRLWD
jgi:hypothetical protein